MSAVRAVFSVPERCNAVVCGMETRNFGVAVLVASACNLLAAQQSAVLACDRDNTLYEDAFGSFSNGSGESIFCGVTAQGRLRRALLRFDTSAIPNGAAVLRAQLRLHVVFSPATGPTPVGVHRLLRDWGEGSSFATSGGGGMGAPSTAGDATWIHTFHPGSPWVAPGGDFAPAPTCTLAMPTGGAFTSPPAAGRALAAEVQQWRNGTLPNHGWLLKTDEASPSARARRIDSRESSGPRPELHVDFLPAGQVGVWGTGCGAAAPATSWSGVPQAGGTVQLVDQAVAGAIGVHCYAFALEPEGFALLPGCRVYLPLAELIVGDVFLVPAAGVVSTPLAIPAGLPPSLLVAQSALLDGSPLGLAPGNAALLVTP